MTYNRMEAKKIKGEHCRFCGSNGAPLVKTPCCQQWICCDTKTLSFRGGGYCQDAHERYSMCYSHFSDGHKGDFKNCQSCLAYWGEKEFQQSLQNKINYPSYTKPCSESEAKYHRAFSNF